MVPLRLYRQILTAAGKMPTRIRQQYVRTRAREAFEEGRSLSAPPDVEDAVRLARVQLQTLQVQATHLQRLIALYPERFEVEADLEPEREPAEPTAPAVGAGASLVDGATDRWAQIAAAPLLSQWNRASGDGGRSTGHGGDMVRGALARARVASDVDEEAIAGGGSEGRPAAGQRSREQWLREKRGRRKGMARLASASFVCSLRQLLWHGRLTGGCNRGAGSTSLAARSLTVWYPVWVWV
jgi:hypothetical protein